MNSDHQGNGAGKRTPSQVSALEYWKDGVFSRCYLLRTEKLVPGDTLVRARCKGRDIRGIYYGTIQYPDDKHHGAVVIVDLDGGEHMLSGQIRHPYGEHENGYRVLRLAEAVENFGVIGPKCEVVQRKHDEDFLQKLVESE